MSDGVPNHMAAEGIPGTSGTTAQGRAVFELQGVTKRFGGVEALRDVDLTLHAGSVLCLLGENGAGKSTLARIIAGAVHADSGSALLDGEPIQILSPAHAHELGVRLVPQELTLCPELSVAENVCLGQWPRRGRLINRREMRAEAARRLGTLGLDHLHLDAPVRHLPVVDQAFVQIARAMTPGARVLITDEPTAPMGADQSERLLTVLDSITRQGVAVVFVSHRLDEVFRVGHEVAVLRDGRKVMEGRVSDISRADLVAGMLGSRELGADNRSDGEVADAGHVALSVSGLRGGDLVDATFSVRTGEVVGVYGSAGSGRDQLGQLIFGSSARLAGNVSVGGRPVTGANPLSSITAGIGYVPAERRSQGLILHASIRENLVLASLGSLSRRGLMRRKGERRLTLEWMGRMYMSAGSTETTVGTLSGGNQQKVLLARWLCRHPPILILDEPTRGVDVGTKADIYSMLWEAAAQGAAVLVISSDVEEVSRVADRVLVLRNGRIAARAGRSTQQEVLAAAMGVSA